MQGRKEPTVSPGLSNTKPDKREKAIELARLAGSAKLVEKKVDLIEIMREIKGK
ncbi:hypothetical protein [Brevibacillus borstelensis]|uniref:hypothetical protein n=1 Tax=Brevibacillus borstelensis TaxID=45462 RepID=UPI001D0A30B5|nr:hypothetical protein [Brevibacillus borstelensis]MCC0566273.1 hypothetical protein [Brevibacillus borstelensis]